MSGPLAPLVWAVLIVLPGAWAAFGLPLRELGLGSRLLLSVALTPAVVFAQYYALRFLGASFEQAAFALPLVNLPAALLVLRAARRAGPVPRGLVGPSLLLVAVVAGFLWIPERLQPEAWLVQGHSWMHTDTVYALADGAWAPEETLLAGLRAAYPWAGHVVPAVLGHVSDAPPIAIYVQQNVVWVLVLAGLCGALAGELGATYRGRAAAALALLLGFNLVGYFLWLGVGFEVSRLPWAGDWRYTPPLWAFRFFNQLAFAMCALAGATLLLLRAARPGSARSRELVLLGLLAVALGWVYPILYPALAALVGGQLVALALAHRRARGDGHLAHAVRLALVFVAASVPVVVLMQVTTADRAEGVLTLAGGRRMLEKAVAVLVSASAFAPFVLVGLRRCAGERRSQATCLLLGAAGCAVLYVVPDIPHWRMEYKFMFALALCLAPLVGLGAEAVGARLGRLRPAVAVAALLLLAVPLWNKSARALRTASTNYPALDVSSFSVRLQPGQPAAAAYAAVRDGTPADTVVLLDAAPLHAPPLLRRSLFAPPDTGQRLGFSMEYGTFLRLVRGYDEARIVAREQARTALFAPGSSDEARAAALGRALALGRPVAVVLEEARHAALDAWLARRAGAGAGALHRSEGLAVWLVRPEASARSGA